MPMAKRDEGKKVNSNINVTPMVDVMLVLLIIFMVITPMLNDKVSVDLPKVTAATVMENSSKEDSIQVAVTRDGATFLGGDKIGSMADLTSRVADLESKKTDPAADKSIYLRADARANFGKVEDTIDALRAAGVNNLNLMTDRSQTN